MNDVFISYSRRDKVFTQKLYEALKAVDRIVWADWDSIPAASDWDAEIKQGIQETNSVLFVLSPEWIKSNECRKELVHAAAMGKRLFPILYLPVDPNDVPPELAKINWVYMRDSDDFDKAFQTLCSAMDIDLDWIKTHTRIQVRALEWEKKKRDHSFVLRGNDLTEGEQFIAGAANKSPVPTALQSEYILASRKDATRRQRQTLAGVTVALIVSIVLGVAALFQRQAAVAQRATAQANLVVAQTARVDAQNNQILADNNAATAVANEQEAKRQAQISRVSELAAQSVSLKESNFPASLLLEVEAFKHTNGLFDSVQAQSALLDNAQTNSQLEKFLSGHTAPVTSLAYSLDGKTLASGSCVAYTYDAGNCGSGEIILWNMETLQPIGMPLSQPAYAMALSPDGSTLASAVDRIYLWDIETRQPIGEPLNGHQVVSVAFSPDGKTLASAQADGSIILWDVETHQPIDLPLNSFASIVAFSPDGKTLASSNWDGNIILWDLETRQSIGQPLSGFTDVDRLAFSPDGSILAWRSALDDTINLWDIGTHQPIGKFSGGDGGGPLKFDFAFSPDGKMLASGIEDGSIFLWDFETGRPIGSPLKGHSNRARAVAFSPDGKNLVSGGDDQAVIVWNLKAPLLFGQTFRNTSLDYVESMAFSADFKTLAYLGCELNEARDQCFTKINISDAETGQQTGQLLSENLQTGLHVAFSPDGKILAAGINDDTIILWDLETRQPLGQPLGEKSDFTIRSNLAFNPDGKTLAAVRNDDTIIIWDLETRQPLGQPLEHSGYLAFSPDGKILASGSCTMILFNTPCNQGEIILWDVETRQPIGQPLIGHSDAVGSIAFSPDDKTLASGGNDNAIIFWNVATHQPIVQLLTGHTNGISMLAFSSNGNILASGGYDGTIILWDLETRQSIGQPLSGFADSVESLAFSPDGSTLASGGNFGGTIILWDISPESWVANACARAGRNFTRAEWAKYFPNEEYRKTCEQWPLEPEATVTATPTP